MVFGIPDDIKPGGNLSPFHTWQSRDHEYEW